MNILDRVIARYVNKRGVGFGGFGAGRINFNTCLTARKLVIDPATGLYVYTGDDRRVFGHVVTDDFVDYIVVNLVAEVAAFGDFKFHDSGTGVGAEAAGDSALGTACGEARDIGTQVNTGAGVYTSVATNTYAGDSPSQSMAYSISLLGVSSWTELYSGQLTWWPLTR